MDLPVHKIPIETPHHGTQPYFPSPQLWAEGSGQCRELSANPGKQRILLVDDSHTSMAIMAELLATDYEVLTASTGRQGLEMARVCRPDLVLLDVVLPDINGFEILQRLRADPVTAMVAVVFVTGFDRPGDEARGLMLGASDYIMKPAEPQVLLARVTAQLRLVRQRTAMEELAHLDELTGIPNRRQFDEVLAAECRRADRQKHPVSVAIVDVDFFKQYNDRYGHPAGDRALKAVARVLRDGMHRPGDLAARYGGEEFALVLGGTSRMGALALANRLRQAVGGLQIAHSDSPIASHLTVSVGVASTIPAADSNPQILVQRADDSLYRAKESGRNKTVADGDSGHASLSMA